MKKFPIWKEKLINRKEKIQKWIKNLLIRIMSLLNWIKTNPVITIICIVFFICAALIIAYFVHFHGKLVDDLNVWSTFGTYFGSITGLIAFMGVLYTIKQSSEQAKINEERNTFFNMISLHYKHVESVVSYNKNGLEAFENFGKIANYYLSIYLAIKNLDDPKFIKRTKSISNEETEARRNFYDAFNYRHSSLLSDMPLGDILLVENFKNLLDVSRPANDYCKTFIHLLDDENRYMAMSYTSKILYKEFGHYLGHYFDNINYIIDIASTFNNCDKYFGIIKAQLSRYELIVILFGIYNTQDSVNISAYVKNDLFYNAYPEDIMIYGKRKSNNYETNKFINSLLRDCKFFYESQF